MPRRDFGFRGTIGRLITVPETIKMVRALHNRGSEVILLKAGLLSKEDRYGG